MGPPGARSGGRRVSFGARTHFFAVALVFHHLLPCKTESFPLISSRCAASLRFLTGREIETCLSPKCPHFADRCESVDAFVTLADGNASFFIGLFLQGVELNSPFPAYKCSTSLSCFPHCFLWWHASGTNIWLMIDM